MDGPKGREGEGKGRGAAAAACRWRSTCFVAPSPGCQHRRPAVPMGAACRCINHWCAATTGAVIAAAALGPMRLFVHALDRGSVGRSREALRRRPRRGPRTRRRWLRDGGGLPIGRGKGGRTGAADIKATRTALATNGCRCLAPPCVPSAAERDGPLGEPQRRAPRHRWRCASLGTRVIAGRRTIDDPDDGQAESAGPAMVPMRAFHRRGSTDLTVAPCCYCYYSRRRL